MYRSFLLLSPFCVHIILLFIRVSILFRILKPDPLGEVREMSEFSSIYEACVVLLWVFDCEISGEGKKCAGFSRGE